MFNKQKIKLEIIRRTAVYGLMSIAAIVITLFLLSVALGYRFNRGSGTLEQNALVQFKTAPAGAMVSIDGKVMGSNTPTKFSVTPKIHHFEISKNGYETWTKDINTQSGTLYWLDYPILIPKNKSTSQVATYQSVYKTLVSPDNRYIIVQKTDKESNFDLLDIKNDDVSTKNLSLPESVLNFSNKDKATYNLHVWDKEGRFVLLSASIDNRIYWISLDTKSPEKSKNITNIVKTDFNDLNFLDSNSNIFYGTTTKGEFKRIDVNSNVQKLIANYVDSFSIYDSKWVFFRSHLSSNKNGATILNIYRDGDESSTQLYKSTTPDEITAISGGNYKGNDYLALLKGNNLEIWNGKFPGYEDKLSEKMLNIDTMNILSNLTKLSFSPKSDYILLQFGSNFGYYYFEHNTKGSFSIPGQVSDANWFNDDYIWTNNQGNLVIREFDGSNVNTLIPCSSDQAVAYTENGKFVYCFQVIQSGFSLSRIKMIVD